MNHYSVTVYYEDTDAGGVVYYANYLKFAERARTEALRSLGLSQRELLEREGIAFVVRRVEVDYRKPARLDDRLNVSTCLIEMGKASLRLQQVIMRNGETLVELIVSLAVVNVLTLKPARIPATLNSILHQWCRMPL